MLFTLAEVLATPSFRRAGVEVVHGSPRSTTVRWVHSSEVYEMGGLLAGGEVLLTSGLGLLGRPPLQLTTYVDRLVDAGCVALAIELGRSFVTMPPEIEAAARRRGLVLLALHEVVPFEQIVEDFHDLVVGRRVAASRTSGPVWQELLGIVVAGQGMGTLLRAVGRLADSTVWFVGPDGTVLERSRPGDLPAGHPTTTADVRGPHGSVGRLVLTGTATDRRSSLVEQAAVAVALELGRAPAATRTPSAAQAVVTEVLAGTLTSDAAVASACREAGWDPDPARHAVAAVLDVDVRVPPHELVPAVRQAVTQRLGAGVVGWQGHHVVVIGPGWVRPEPGRVRDALSAVLDDLGGEGAPVHVMGVAAPVAALASLPSAVATAQEVTGLARRIGSRERVVLARDLGPHRMLARLPASELMAFVTEQVGALIAHDAAHGTDLVRTVDAYLASRSTKAVAAQVLGIRRQSLYARITRIESLLGVPLDDAGHQAGLALAIAGWRMRTGSDPQVSSRELTSAVAPAPSSAI
ncbi:MAG: PucR family transcriptional regulator ligand-binding domain-containing protein [Nocardioidaceae bacterium]|nr:PucR family transcriptional regulator ligand-binding domain-containing protein [Nocardioidaceae bacterium]